MRHGRRPLLLRSWERISVQTKRWWRRSRRSWKDSGHREFRDRRKIGRRRWEDDRLDGRGRGRSRKRRGIGGGREITDEREERNRGSERRCRRNSPWNKINSSETASPHRKESPVWWRRIDRGAPTTDGYVIDHHGPFRLRGWQRHGPLEVAIPPQRLWSEAEWRWTLRWWKSEAHGDLMTPFEIEIEIGNRRGEKGTIYFEGSVKWRIETFFLPTRVVLCIYRFYNYAYFNSDFCWFTWQMIDNFDQSNHFLEKIVYLYSWLLRQGAFDHKSVESFYIQGK